MSDYNRHKWAMEWMHGGGRDPNGRSLDDEIRIGKEDWLDRQKEVTQRIGFKHGGSWADWKSNHSDQMTFEEYLQMDIDKPVHPIDKSTGGSVSQLVQPGPGRPGYKGEPWLIKQKQQAKNIKIKSDKTGVATDPYTGKTHEGIAQQTHMEVTKGDYVKNKQGKMVKEGDEYFEGTVRPDRDGKMKDIIEEIDEVDHLELKKIADEIDTLVIKKASGGLAYALGE